MDFATKSDWTTTSPGNAAAEPRYEQEYDSDSQRWELKRMEASHVWIDPSKFGTQVLMVRVILHELIHGLGLSGHPYIEKFPESLMRNAWPSILATDIHIPHIDADTLLAIYTRLEPGTEPEELSPASLGPWDNKSLRIHGELDIPASASFGVSFRNNLARPWAIGLEPSIQLAENPDISGNVSWNGVMAGYTPEGNRVHGDAEFSIDLGVLTGSAHFNHLWEYRNAWLVWGDGDLRYAIAVRGNTFRETGGDDGILTGHFVGRQHEGAVGVLEREDLSAAFGAERIVVPATDDDQVIATVVEP